MTCHVPVGQQVGGVSYGNEPGITIVTAVTVAMKLVSLQ